MQEGQQSQAAEPRAILVRGVNWIGDAVMSTPALQRLRARFPRAEITLLTQEKIAGIWQHHPSLNRVLTFSSGQNPWAVARAFSPGAFQLALVLPNSPRSALEVWLARIPQRIGYARPWRNWFLTQALPPYPGHLPMRKKTLWEIRRCTTTGSPGSNSAAQSDQTPRPSPHHINAYLYLVASLGADPNPLPPKLEVTTEEIQQVTATWLSDRRGGSPFVLGLNPSAAYGPAKCWPAQNFAAVARDISQRLPEPLWLIFGTAHDRQVCEQVARQAGGRVLNLAGQTSLRQLMALLKLCRVVLTNDSGPMHVAAALGTPVVVPFGSTSPQQTGPGLPGMGGHQLLESGVPCAPCYRRTCPIDFRCMHSITVERVTGAVLQALESGPTRV